MNKIENAKVNRKLIGDEITVSKINKTRGDGGKGPKGPKQPTLREMMVDIRKDITSLRNDFNRIVELNNLKQ